MADTVKEVGFVLSVKDNASAAIKGVGVSVKTATKAVGLFGKAGSQAFDGIRAGADVMFKAMEIGKRAFEILNATLGESIRKALEFRRKGDPVLKWFKDMQRETDVLRARVGDALIPVVQGLAEGFGLVGDGASKWVAQNQRLIGTKILEWLQSVGHFLINGIAIGATLAGKAFLGWELIISGVQAVVNKFFATFFEGNAQVLDAMSSMARAVGAGGFADALKSATNYVRGFGNEFEASGDKAAKEVEKTVAKIDELDLAIKKLKLTAESTLDKGIAKGLEKVNENSKGVRRTIDEQAAASVKAREDAKKTEEAVIAMSGKMSAAMGEASDKSAKAASTISGGYDTIVASMEKSIAVATESMVTGEKTAMRSLKDAAKETRDIIISTMKQVVLAEAIKASSRVFSGFSTIPIVGPALGAAAGAAAFGVVMGLLSLAKFQQGGIVTGGTPGIDSVPALLMPGERVMTVNEVHQEKSGGRPQPRQRPVTIVNNFNSVVPPQSADAKRAARRIKNDVDRVNRLRPVLVG